MKVRKCQAGISPVQYYKLVLSILVASSVPLLQNKGPRISNLAEANVMAARLVDLINREDSVGILQYTAPDFFKAISAAQLPGLVQQLHSMGTMSAPTLILDLVEQRKYKITVKHEGRPDRQIQMILGCESASKLFLLGFARFSDPKSKATKIATDNPHQSKSDQIIESSVDRFLAVNRCAGLSIAVADGKHEAFYNYGEITVGSGHLPNSRTIYEIGSITKTMSGILVAKGVMDHKLNLSTDIRQYLPGSYPNLQFEGKPILLKHLVTHTSGLPANPPGIPDDGKAGAYEKFSHEKLLSNLADIRLTRAPGDVFSYSNMGGGLIAPLLEHVHGKQFEAQLNSQIFSPARMSHTGIKLTPEMDAHYATPYDASGSKTDRWTVNGIESAGAVRSNPEDMLRYAHLNLDRRNPIIALSHQTQTSEGMLPVGIFWLLGDSRLGGHYVDHEGGTGGFTSHILIMPSSKLAVVVMMNTGEQKAGDLAYEIALGLLASRQSK